MVGIKGADKYVIMLVCNGEKLTLGINPEEIEIDQPSMNTEQEIISLGQVNVAGKAGLQVVSFDDLPCFARGGIKGIDAPLTLQRFQASGLPIEIFTNSDILRFMNGSGSSLWLIESLKVTERAGEESDFYLTAKFKQFRSYTARKYTVTPNTDDNSQKVTQKEPERVDTQPRPLTHTIKSGEDLWTIARHYLGNGARWQEIYNLNRNVIKNPSLIYPGQVITIPKK